MRPFHIWHTEHKLLCTLVVLITTTRGQVDGRNHQWNLFTQGMQHSANQFFPLPPEGRLMTEIPNETFSAEACSERADMQCSSSSYCHQRADWWWKSLMRPFHTGHAVSKLLCTPSFLIKGWLVMKITDKYFLTHGVLRELLCTIMVANITRRHGSTETLFAQ